MNNILQHMDPNVAYELHAYLSFFISLISAQEPYMLSTEV